MINKKMLIPASLFLVFLSGCIPYFKLSKSEFPQGKDLDINQLMIVHEYTKSANIYEKYTTLAIFDALWLSDNVRNAYVNLNSQKSGKSQTAKEALLNRQLEENKHWISFYVLADIRHQANGTMNEKNPLWSVFLDLGHDRKVEPESVKEVDLDPEFQFFFGERLNSFKTAYLVQFPLLDAEGKNYLAECTILKLAICSVNKSCELTWNLADIQTSLNNISKSKKKVKRYEDFYWG